MKTNEIKLSSCVLAVAVMVSGPFASAQISKYESSLEVIDTTGTTSFHRVKSDESKSAYFMGVKETMKL